MISLSEIGEEAKGNEVLIAHQTSILGLQEVVELRVVNFGTDVAVISGRSITAKIRGDLSRVSMRCDRWYTDFKTASRYQRFHVTIEDKDQDPRFIHPDYVVTIDIR